MKQLTLLLLLISGCGFNRLSNGEVSQRLSIGMTEQQVASLRPPNRVQMQACGYSTAGQVMCKLYIYDYYISGGYSEHALTILFENVGGKWIVNSWS